MDSLVQTVFRELGAGLVAAIIAVLGARAANPSPLRFLNSLSDQQTTPLPTQSVAKAVILPWIRNTFPSRPPASLEPISQAAFHLIDNGITFGHWQIAIQPAFRFPFGEGRPTSDLDSIVGARLLKGKISHLLMKRESEC
jgi:hypothetical protein